MNNFLHNDLFLKKYAAVLMTALRIGIAIIFLWFGALKIFGFNPVFDLIYFSMFPLFAEGLGLVVLGIAEALIGFMLLTNRALLVTHVVLLFHLLGTFTTFIFGWHVIFDPQFPVLSLSGEFVIKNIVLAISGLAVLVYELRRQRI